jgi:hypothetical protein
LRGLADLPARDDEGVIDQDPLVRFRIEDLAGQHHESAPAGTSHRRPDTGQDLPVGGDHVAQILGSVVGSAHLRRLGQCGNRDRDQDDRALRRAGLQQIGARLFIDDSKSMRRAGSRTASSERYSRAVGSVTRI